MVAKIRRGGFTLFEVLIIVVILAVLAATIIPQFVRSTREAQQGQWKSDLQSLRAQLDLYKLQHGGSYPSGANNLEQLTKATDAAGNVSNSGLADNTHPLGPYFSGNLPAQPVSGTSTVKLDAGAPGTAPAATAGNDGGWIYRASTGEIWIDHPDYVTQ